MSFDQPTVLIADPHEEYRSGLVRSITMHPSLCLDSVADDGFDALALIMTRRPDLALLDVRLAGLDAFGISERVNDERAVLKTRIVLLTAVLDSAQRARALSVGAAECLAKDASRSEICDTLLAVARGERLGVNETTSRVARSVPRPVGVRGADD